MAKFWLLVACKRYWGGISSGYSCEMVEKKYVCCVGTCLNFFAGLFIYCGAFLIVVSRVFSHKCIKSYETLAVVHKCTYICNFLPSIEHMY